MNKILNKFGFGLVCNKRIKKEKRTKEVFYFIRDDGWTLGAECSLPQERAKTIQEGYQKYPEAKYVNIIPLRGRHMVKAKEIQ